MDFEYGKEEKKRKKETLFDKRSKRSLSILIVDDNKVVNRILEAEVLYKFGYIADIEGDPEAVLDRMRQTAYDIVFLDISMPKISGYELSMQIRKDAAFQNTILIELTANICEDVIKKVKEAGMNNYLPKPIPMEQLKSILETYTAQTIHTLHAPQIIETTAQTDELIAFKGLEEQFYGDKEAAAKMCLMDIKKQKWNEAHGEQLFLVFEQTMQAANGREALSLMQTKQFDLYLVDVMMPIMNGLEFLKELKERGITAPRIIASNYNEFDYVRQGMKLGAMDYLLKPVTEEELRECLQNVREENEQSITEEIFRICGADTTSGFA